VPAHDKLRILVADDHDIIRRGVRDVLSSQLGWEVCAEATTGREAVSLAEEHRPDIVVMDVGMPRLNGLEAARAIRKILPKAEILILSVHYAEHLVRLALDAGAHGYILKSDPDQNLLAAVEALANHRSFFTPRAAQLIVNGAFERGSSPFVMRKLLTAREREIMQLVAEGSSSKQIALTLGISVKTAETHRANIMRKLELKSVSDLVRYALKNKMIEP